MPPQLRDGEGTALPGRIRAAYNGGSIHISRPGRCTLCPVTWSLTKHHIFGKGHPVTMRLCASCHTAFNTEMNNKAPQAGPFVRHVIAILSAVWPITTPLPPLKHD